MKNPLRMTLGDFFSFLQPPSALRHVIVSLVCTNLTFLFMHTKPCVMIEEDCFEFNPPFLPFQTADGSKRCKDCKDPLCVDMDIEGKSYPGNQIKT